VSADERYVPLGEGVKLHALASLTYAEVITHLVEDPERRAGLAVMRLAAPDGQPVGVVVIALQGLSPGGRDDLLRDVTEALEQLTTGPDQVARP
jgi:hypothetical protein